VVVAGFIALLASVVAIGIGGRTAPGPAGALPAFDAGSPSTGSPQRTEAAPTPATARESFTPIAILTGGLGGPLELRIRRPAASIFVHGDVFAPKVTWVFVSLQDSRGDVKGFASVSVPGSAVAGSLDGPSLRFDLDVAVPPELAGQAVWVQAIAYDAAGKVVGTVRVGVAADGNPVDGPAASGDPVHLSTPSRDDQVITTETVLVDGRMQIKAATVEITLDGGAAQRFDAQTFDTSDPDGGIRPDRAPAFHFELALPAPRPEGRVWVVVTAHDAAGREIGTLRRPVIIAAVDE
jgi:hypothetical protein